MTTKATTLTKNINLTSNHRCWMIVCKALTENTYLLTLLERTNRRKRQERIAQGSTSLSLIIKLSMLRRNLRRRNRIKKSDNWKISNPRKQEKMIWGSLRVILPCTKTTVPLRIKQSRNLLQKRLPCPLWRTHITKDRLGQQSSKSNPSKSHPRTVTTSNPQFLHPLSTPSNRSTTQTPTWKRANNSKIPEKYLLREPECWTK